MRKTQGRLFGMAYSPPHTQKKTLSFCVEVSTLFRQGSHSTWKTWKNESTPGNIMEF